MEPNSHQRDLASILEEMLFARHATRKNRLDIQRFVTTLLDAVREEVARQAMPRDSHE